MKSNYHIRAVLKIQFPTKTQRTQSIGCQFKFLFVGFVSLWEK